MGEHPFKKGDLALFIPPTSEGERANLEALLVGAWVIPKRFFETLLETSSVAWTVDEFHPDDVEPAISFTNRDLGGYWFPASLFRLMGADHPKAPWENEEVEDTDEEVDRLFDEINSRLPERRPALLLQYLLGKDPNVMVRNNLKAAVRAVVVAKKAVELYGAH